MPLTDSSSSASSDLSSTEYYERLIAERDEEFARLLAQRDQENSRLQGEVNELRNEMNNLTYVEYDDSKDDEVVTVASRVVTLDKIPHPVMHYLLQSKTFTDDDESRWPAWREERKVLESNLIGMSIKLARRYYAVRGHKPRLDRRTRRNKYYLNDFLEFGDDIINEHFVKKPFDTWYKEDIVVQMQEALNKHQEHLV